MLTVLLKYHEQAIIRIASNPVGADREVVLAGSSRGMFQDDSSGLPEHNEYDPGSKGQQEARKIFRFYVAGCVVKGMFQGR